jgi:large conductance mechanosensitive channel
MLKEFRDFAMRGNVIDLAFGVIIGVAFGSIVTSLVNDIIMPPIGYLSGGLDFSNYFVDLTEPSTALTLAQAKEAKHAVIAYGAFINTIINFLIVAFALFMVVKQINRFKKKEAAAAPAGPTPTEALLAEIRDELKKGR